jgi:hypothetical protein
MEQQQQQQGTGEPQVRTKGRGVTAVVATLLLGPGAGHLAKGRVCRAVVWFVVGLLVILPVVLGPWLIALPFLLRIVAVVPCAMGRRTAVSKAEPIGTQTTQEPRRAVVAHPQILMVGGKTS